MPRPIKFNEDVLKALLEGINKRLTLKAACRYAGISYSTLALWCARGRLAIKQGRENKYSRVSGLVDDAYYQMKVEHSRRFFFDIQPTDYRWGYRKPMSQVTKNKIRQAIKGFREFRQLSPELLALK